MATAGLRERKKAKTRDALARAALRQFAERGFEHVTVEEIAAECEVSPRTFFRYYATKEDALFGDADEARRRLLDALAEQPRDEGVLAALRGAVLAVAGELEHDRELTLLRQRVVAADPSLRGRSAERFHGWTDAVTTELRKGGWADRTSELDLRLAVAASATALSVATALWAEDGGEGDLTALLTDVLDRLRTGLDA